MHHRDDKMLLPAGIGLPPGGNGLRGGEQQGPYQLRPAIRFGQAGLRDLSKYVIITPTVLQVCRVNRYLNILHFGIRSSWHEVNGVAGTEQGSIDGDTLKSRLKSETSLL